MLPSTRGGWLRHLVAARGSLSHGVVARVVAFGVLAIGVVIADRWGFQPHLPIGVHEVAGAVIALLLAFRTNTAYQRFWEARTLWGSLVNASRNLARIVTTYGHEQPEGARHVARYAVAFAHATRRRLRYEATLDVDLPGLSRDEREAVERAGHPALHAAEQMSLGLVRLATVMPPLMLQLAEEQVISLVESLGGCERISKTPTPLGYVLLIQRVAALFLATLPFALVQRVGLATPFIMIIVAYPLLMIEALGSELDDPFGYDSNDLALNAICATIQSDLTSTSAELPDDRGPFLNDGGIVSSSESMT